MNTLRQNDISSGSNQTVFQDKNRLLALDCEMVGIGPKAKKNALARVSIVDYEGKTVLDTFVKPKNEVTDYRTPFSGVTPELLESAPLFDEVKIQVENLLKDRILIGFALQHDLKVLEIRHPMILTRNIQLYKNFRKMSRVGRYPSLKFLAKEILGIKIQENAHDSVEDARATMELYRKYESQIEEDNNVNGYLRL
ncbi:hypothetical protein G9A89_002165 [Geosiphon pyriformis]|nr:hypothetical protein G9A89_001585 [Geosiphon pyriformis]KAG9296768.1 hypothetical protein G9A89_002165 [Geosiphon pyriformis]